MQERKKFRLFHNSLLEFLMADPSPGNQSRAAKHFGVTNSTISIIINSRVFQEKLKERQDESYVGIVLDLKSRMVAVADKGLQRLEQTLDMTNDTKVIVDATDKVLERLGYGAKKEDTIREEINTTVVISKELLEETQAKMIKGGRVIDNQPNCLEKKDEIILGKNSTV